MNIINKLLVGSAGLAMVAGMAAPAAAQYAYPPQYGTNNGGSVVGAIINSVLGGGRYGTYGQGTDRTAVDQCARAAEVRVSSDSRYGYSQNGYGQGAYGYQNDPRYSQGYRTAATARVVAVTGVQRRSSGLKVTGLIDTNNGYGDRGYQGQPYPNQAYGDPRYQGQYPNQAYGDPRYQGQYPNAGVDPRYGGFNGQGYANAAQYAELKFNCRVDYRGQITRLSIERNDMIGRGY